MISTVLPTVIPVFGLIALGYLAGRSGYLSEAAVKGLPEFVFRIAMPIMLFRTIGQAQMPDAAPVMILVMFFGAAFITWALASILTGLVLRRPQADASTFGMASTFSNSVMMGLPIALSHYGAQAAPVIALIVLCDTAVLWLAAALYLAATDRVGAQTVGTVLTTVVRRVGTNPVILGCLAGLVWQMSSLAMPPLADRMVTMLAQAAIPGALVSLGLALNSYGLGGQLPAVAMITILKMLVMPTLAYIIGTHVLRLPPLDVGVVTILAAMPVGANAYLFAAANDRQPAAVSGSIAATTPLALLTVTALLIFLGPASR